MKTTCCIFYHLNIITKRINQMWEQLSLLECFVLMQPNTHCSSCENRKALVPSDRRRRCILWLPRLILRCSFSCKRVFAAVIRVKTYYWCIFLVNLSSTSNQNQNDLKLFWSSLWVALNKMSMSQPLVILGRGQEATVGTECGDTEWCPVDPGVRQGCILPPCLFNLNAEYIIKEWGILRGKRSGNCWTNISNLKYTVDTNLLQEVAIVWTFWWK